jgi:uracil phosphoribosyltransferase
MIIQCEESLWLEVVLSHLRDSSTPIDIFRRYAEHLGDHLIQTAIDKHLMPLDRSTSIRTPTGSIISSSARIADGSIVAVSVVRAGNAFVPSVLKFVSPRISVGQVVIQRDEKTALPKTLLKKLPSGIAQADCVLLLDPMLATGGSIIAAIDILVSSGVAPDKIVLIHGFGCPEGVAAVSAAFPSVRGIVGVIDSHLNEKKYIIPGCGDFGDRYYGT